MIITQRLVWHHLPKTAGTTTDQLFVSSGLKLLWRDSQDSFLKHLPPSDYSSLDSALLEGKKPVINFRRLPFWLLSNYQHKLKRMYLDLPAGPMTKGLFWRDREQCWLPADWWLERFNIDSNWCFLRVDNLKHDFLSCLRTYDPIGLYSRFKIGLVHSKNRTSYNRLLQQWFSESDLAAIYCANPLWTSFERKVYGSLLTKVD